MPAVRLLRSYGADRFAVLLRNPRPIIGHEHMGPIAVGVHHVVGLVGVVLQEDERFLAIRAASRAANVAGNGAAEGATDE